MSSTVRSEIAMGYTCHADGNEDQTICLTDIVRHQVVDRVHPFLLVSTSFLGCTFSEFWMMPGKSIKVTSTRSGPATSNLTTFLENPTVFGLTMSSSCKYVAKS